MKARRHILAALAAVDRGQCLAGVPVGARDAVILLLRAGGITPDQIARLERADLRVTPSEVLVVEQKPEGGVALHPLVYSEITREYVLSVIRAYLEHEDCSASRHDANGARRPLFRGLRGGLTPSSVRSIVCRRLQQVRS